MLKRLVLMFSLVLSTSLYAETPENVVQNVMQQYMQKNDVPGAAVIVYVNGTPSTYYFGVADKQSKKPVTQDTIFELGSLTKLMTSILLAQEVDFAKINLKAPINKYIPTLPAAFSGMTVRSLATHTSGLPFETPPTVKSRADWEKFAMTWKSDNQADAQYQYSNVGMGLIGYALESVTHQDYNKLYRTKILAPLNMQPIALTVPKKLQEFYAQGYDDTGAPAAHVADGVFPAAYAMKASASDMNKFLSAAIGLPQTPQSVFYPVRLTQTAFLAVGDSAQGLGWQIHDTTAENIKDMLKGVDLVDVKRSYPVATVFKDPVFNGKDLIDKTGSTNGFRDYIAVLPDKKSGIVILTNRNVPGPAIVVAAREILFKLNGM